MVPRHPDRPISRTLTLFELVQPGRPMNENPFPGFCRPGSVLR
jgi:hypothetical protein